MPLCFFFNDTATTEIYTLSLHDALPIFKALERWPRDGVPDNPGAWITTTARNQAIDRVRRAQRLGEKTSILAGLEARSEEHTSELQSQSNLVCRLLLEKKKKNNNKVSEP